MEPVYFFSGGLILIIFLIKRELLIGDSRFIILILAVAMFLAGIALHFTASGRDSASAAFVCPLITLGVFQIARRMFYTKVKREPSDTFLNFKRGIGADAVFNVIFATLAALIWIFVPLLMHRLAKAGW